MTPRSLLLVPLVASGLLAAPAAADRLLVGGPDGFVMHTDAGADALTYFTCTCNGPIRALAADERRLYVADEFESIVVFDLDDGALRNFFWANVGPVSALAAGGGALFVGSEDGRVARMDPLTGAVLGVTVAPAGVKSLLVHGDGLFAATADSAVWRAPLAGGDFAYFGCFCFFDVQGMVAHAGDLFVVDAGGTVARLDGTTGAVESAFWVGGTNSMAVADGVLFFYYAGGTISRFDADTGQPLPDTITSPIGVEAMLAVPDPRTKTRRAPLPEKKL